MTNAELLKWITDKCIRNGITLVLNTNMDDSYFEHNSVHFKNKPEINIYVNRSDTLWISDLLHEWCHAEQWLEDSPLYWEIAKYNLLEDTANWHKYSRKELKVILGHYRDVELDCERRVIKHIKEKRLQIDLDTYIRNASALIYHYNMMLDYGWKHNPCDIEEIVDSMPTDMNRTYRNTPSYLKELYKKHYGNPGE